MSGGQGYASGRFTVPGATTNTIDKFPFSSDANASDVGDLNQSRGYTGGVQG